MEVEQEQEVEEEKKPSNPEQEREAILKMIAEGRITPEEGDMLLALPHHTTNPYLSPGSIDSMLQ